MDKVATAWADALGAVPLADDLDVPPGVCLRCRGRAGRYGDGRPCLCRACTLAELGVSEAALCLSIETHRSVKATEAKLFRDGPPHVNPKAWTTPRSRYRS